MTTQNSKTITIASILNAPNLASRVAQLLQAPSQMTGLYGSKRLAAETLNDMFGTVWAEDSPSTAEGQFARAYAERLVKSSLPQPRSNLSKDWRDIQDYGKEGGSLLRELVNKKTGAKLKELDAAPKKKP